MRSTCEIYWWTKYHSASSSRINNSDEHIHMYGIKHTSSENVPIYGIKHTSSENVPIYGIKHTSSENVHVL